MSNTTTGNVQHFNSGSNNPGEIKGLHRAGQNVGVTAPNISKNGEAALMSLAGTSTKVFIDSGAFSEIAFTANGPQVVKPITSAEWTKRLGMYLRLAHALRNQLYVVAPDMIANQKVTLERLHTYAPAMREISMQGANVILPVQKGATSMADFYRAGCEILGFDCIAGIPLKKDATKLEELVEFVRVARPVAVHLLGMGSKSRKFAQTVAAIRKVMPEIVVFCDSARIRALVGWGQDGKSPRLLTGFRAQVRNEGHSDDTFVCEEATFRAFMADAGLMPAPAYASAG